MRIRIDRMRRSIYFILSILSDSVEVSAYR